MSNTTNKSSWSVRQITLPTAGVVSAFGNYKAASLASILQGGPAVDFQLFEFKKDNNTKVETYAFIGYGLGVGFKMGGGISKWIDLPLFDNMDEGELDGAWGRLTYAGAGWGMGYAKSFITAFKGSKVFFESVGISGMEAGTGASASCVTGKWQN